MKRLMPLSIAIATFVLVFIGQAADVRYKVYVDVQCKDEDTKAFVESHIKRELRALQDVDIGGGIPIPRIFILVIVDEIKYMSGRTTGLIAISYAFVESFADYFMDEYVIPDKRGDALARLYKSLDEYVIPDKRGTALEDLWDAYRLPHLNLMTCSKPILDEACKKIVVKFDTNVLEPLRRL